MSPYGISLNYFSTRRRKMCSKQKVAFVLILMLILAVVFAGCSYRDAYKLLHDVDQISSVEIVTVFFDDEGIANQQVKVRISDVEAFIKDFRSVTCYCHFGGPTGVEKSLSGNDVIKITYQNGEYELIDWKGQSEYTQERGFYYYAGFNVFDEEQFEELIEKYSSVT
jgi:hypothetical protein